MARMARRTRRKTPQTVAKRATRVLRKYQRKLAAATRLFARKCGKTKNATRRRRKRRSMRGGTGGGAEYALSIYGQNPSWSSVQNNAVSMH